MSASDKSTKDKEMSSYMKKHPGSYPDSVSSGGWQNHKLPRAMVARKSSEFSKYWLAMMAGPHLEAAMAQVYPNRRG